MSKKVAKTLFKDKINIYVSECLSTNDFLTQFIKKNNNEEGVSVISDFQIKGRGQRNNTWYSEKGKNLLFSFFIKPKLSIQDQFKLHIITSLSIKKTLDKIGLANVKVKWPNDIYVNEKKISGILIESQLSNKKIAQSIIGIGLNVNQKNFNQLNATSIINELNHEYDLNKVLKIFCSFFEKEYIDISKNINSLKETYKNSLYGLNKTSKFYHKSTMHQGEIIDINSDGAIIIKVNDRKVKYYFGSISFT